MGTPPAKTQLRRLLEGKEPNGPLQTGTSVNHAWVGAVNHYLFTSVPVHLNYGRRALFGPQGFVGSELLGYQESYLGGLFAAMVHAYRTGQDQVAKALRERAEDLLSLLALFQPARPRDPLVYPGVRQGWIVKDPDGTVVRDSTESLAAVLAMAQSGTLQGPRREDWLSQNDHLAAWTMGLLITEEWQPPEITTFRPELQARARRAGLHVPIEYVAYQRGWRARIATPVRPWDQPDYAAVAGPGGVRVLTPSSKNNEAWPTEAVMAEDTGRSYGVSVHVERLKDTPQQWDERWTGAIRYDDLGLGGEAWRETFHGGGREPWDFGGGEAPAPPPDPQPPKDEEEPVDEMIARWKIRNWLRADAPEAAKEHLPEIGYQAQRLRDGEPKARERLDRAVDGLREGEGS